MSYRKLLVGLADPVVAPRVMAAGAALAAEHRAHLVAVHVTSSGTSWEAGVSVTEYAEALRGIYEAHRDDDAFSSEWRAIEGAGSGPGGALVELGNACDLLVLGHRHEREAERSGRYLGEHVIGVTARPVLLIPDVHGRPFAAKRVLVAWDNGAEIARAAFDALPLLRRADEVRVHRFDPPAGDRRHVGGTAEAFADALSRHEVAVELSRSDVDRSEIGDAILALAGDWGADLVVAGSRLHGRVREYLFGGTTRHLLGYAARPLLIGG